MEHSKTMEENLEKLEESGDFISYDETSIDKDELTLYNKKDEKMFLKNGKKNYKC